jgi:HD-like signal output (HDOD) protein
MEEENFRLPVFDRIAMKLQQIISRDDYAVSEIEQVIQSDPALAGEVLKAANSPYYKGLVEIKSVSNAIVRLGAAQVVDLALMMSQKSKYSANDKFIQKLMSKSWQGAVACAMTSRWLSERLAFDDSSEVFMGGLLHDIGYLFLLTVIDRLIEAGSVPVDFSRSLVIELLTTLHAEKGYELLKEWNLPDIYCVIARDHHVEEFDTSNTSLCIVRLADKACIKLGLCIEHDESILLQETREAEELGITPIMLAEMEIMMEDAFRGVKA